MTDEPPEEVQRAHRVLRAWRLRNGHEAYVEPLGSGYVGFQARCWDCEWTGAEHLRGDEPMDTPESRAHKANARAEASAHGRETRPAVWTSGIDE